MHLVRMEFGTCCWPLSPRVFDTDVPLLTEFGTLKRVAPRCQFETRNTSSNKNISLMTKK